MALNEKSIITCGHELYSAFIERRTVAPLSQRYDLEIEDAYHIQEQFVNLRLEKGEHIIGKKIGLTSKVVQQMLEVDQPDFGYLLSDMVFSEGESIPIDTLIQPRAEGEIAFILKRDLLGPGITYSDVIRATECVMPCFEIVDSRIHDWKISIQDTISDNASCGVFVLGNQAVNPRKVDLTLCGMVLEKNGELIATGAGAAALGSPVNAVVWLANTLGQLGIPLKAGEVILSGALAALVPVKTGDSLRVAIGGIGHCSTRFH